MCVILLAKPPSHWFPEAAGNPPPTFSWSQEAAGQPAQLSTAPHCSQVADVGGLSCGPRWLYLVCPVKHRPQSMMDALPRSTNVAHPVCRHWTFKVVFLLPTVLLCCFCPGLPNFFHSCKARESWWVPLLHCGASCMKPVFLLSHCS